MATSSNISRTIAQASEAVSKAKAAEENLIHVKHLWGEDSEVFALAEELSTGLRVKANQAYRDMCCRMQQEIAVIQ